MLPDNTTTIGEGELVATDRPFHNIKAVDSTRAKLSACASNWRGDRAEREESIVTGGTRIGRTKGQSEEDYMDQSGMW